MKTMTKKKKKSGEEGKGQEGSENAVGLISNSTLPARKPKSHHHFFPYACAQSSLSFHSFRQQRDLLTLGCSTDVFSSQLPRSNKLCPSCHENEAVFFQSQQRSAETGMKLFYVCCSCGTIFQ